MKCAVVIFHKNVSRYPTQWISQCVDSIRNQSYKDFDVHEVDYGNSGTQIYEGSFFESMELQDHAVALNYLLDKVFALGYECAFNVNVDDHYDPNRFALQIEAIKNGADIVSSNFYIVNENNHLIKEMDLSGLDPIKESQENTNIIAHPVVCYSNRFKGKLISSQIPRDDFELWIRCYEEKKYKFVILPQFLLYYRVHQQKVS
jgi:hypothetical protein